VCAAGAVDPFIAHAMHTIQDVGTRDGWRRFVATMFHEDTMTVRDVGRVLDVHHSTIGSRFNRARLATPKRLLAYVRLIAAARLLEHPDATIDDVSARLGHSSSQSFGRHIRKLIGMTAVQFRDRFNGAAMLGKTMRDLIEPHRDRLTTFDPFHGES
jgi:AraC-like DNA-binding protein